MYPAISSLSHPPPTPSIPEDQWHFSPILLHPTYCISHYQLDEGAWSPSASRWFSELRLLLHCTMFTDLKTVKYDSSYTKGTSSWAGLNWDGTRHRELSSNKILWLLRCGLVMSGTGRVYEFMLKLPRFNYVYLHILHILQLCSSPARRQSKLPKSRGKALEKALRRFNDHLIDFHLTLLKFFPMANGSVDEVHPNGTSRSPISMHFHLE